MNGAVINWIGEKQMIIILSMLEYITFPDNDIVQKQLSILMRYTRYSTVFSMIKLL